VWKCKSLNGEEMWLCVLELVVFRFFVGVFGTNVLIGLVRKEQMIDDID
tara:strand:- start:232 stop:378 length:147 start_codon:yes stop_codon:yes gene_type:complete